MINNKKNRVYLKEESDKQVTLNDLMDLGTKAQIAVIQLADQCMKFNNDHLRKISAQVNKEVAELCNQIKGAIINNNMDVSDDVKKQLDAPGEKVRQSPNAKVFEAKNQKNKIKKLFEALNEILESDEVEETDVEEAPELVDETEAADDETTDSNDSKVIDLSTPFESVIDGLDDEQFQTFKKDVIDVLKGSSIVDPAYQTLVQNMEEVETAEDFNFGLDAIYDYADENNIEITTESKSE